MPLELTPVTGPGRQLAALARGLAEQLGERAAAHDRDATYPHDGVRLLRAAGYYAAPVPESLGGMGVDSVHDLVVASSLLAAGDASVAIGVNMHMAVLSNIARLWRHADADGNEPRAATLAEPLRAAVRDEMIIATAVSEPGQDLTRPATTATRTGDGWRIDGRKIFCTGSPGATTLYVALSYAGEGRDARYGYAAVPAEAPGVVFHDDWDALGMRASGSQSVSFEGVLLPHDAVGGGFAADDARAYMERNLAAGLFHASASLGIAESADRVARTAAAKRGALDGRAQVLIGENAIDLTAARATLSRAAALQDGHRDTAVLGLFAEAQAAKAFVNEAAARIVDRALALSGGAGYLNGHPLARAYRDVKAGAFMHPLGANRAYAFLADVSLGREPALH
ncbi:MAG: acyl-CoA dehydrogenase family protein [Solirubrobacteraceae bacterium]